jgi:hypothetical protein
MSQLFIRKTIQIYKDNLSVFKLINDFHHWPKWSPWLITDPNAVVKVDPDGKYYNWKSPILGSGEMRIIHEEKGQSINCELQFFKPSFLINPEGKYLGYPYRNHVKGTKLYGYSDHFPVYIIVGKKN